MGQPKAFRTFDEFWPFYLAQHLHPTCRALHLAGTSLAAGLLGASVLAPPLALAAPVVGYGLAWIGHTVFERNVPATFTYPLWSFLGDLKMLLLFLLGRLAPEIEHAKSLYPEYVLELEVVPVGNR